MNCGKPIFFNNGRFYTQHDNGVDCVMLDLSGLKGRDGGRGPAGAAGASADVFDFGIAITSNRIAGDGNTNQTLTAVPSAGAVLDYTYAFALVSRDTRVGQIDPVLGPPVNNTIIASNPSAVPIQGMIRVRATHTATGTIQESEFMVTLDGAPI